MSILSMVVEEDERVALSYTTLTDVADNRIGVTCEVLR
jgi:hypothetical protein